MSALKMSAFGIESGGWFGEADRDERAGDRAAADAGAGKREVDQSAARAAIHGLKVVYKKPS